MRHATLVVVAALLLTAQAAGSSSGPQVVRTADPAKRGLKETDFPRIQKLAPNVYSYEQLRSAGDEKFTTVSLFVVTSAGVLVADGQGSVPETRRMVEEIAKITPQPITHVVVCSDHGDHTAGNGAFPAGATFYAHPTSKAVLEASAGRSGRGGDNLAVPVPSQIVQDKTVLKLGGTEIQLLFLGRAHTGGDLSVYLPKERILFMSEAYLNRVFPAMRSAFPTEWVGRDRKSPEDAGGRLRARARVRRVTRDSQGRARDIPEGARAGHRRGETAPRRQGGRRNRRLPKRSSGSWRRGRFGRAKEWWRFGGSIWSSTGSCRSKAEGPRRADERPKAKDPRPMG